MRFTDYIKLAFKNISRRKLRSFLTIISIVIGALAVVSVLTLIFSAKTVFMKQLEAEGSFTLVYVTPDQENLEEGGPFGDSGGAVSDTQKKIDDQVVADLKKISHVIGASPSTRLWNLQSVRAKDGDGKKYRADVEAYETGKATEKTILAGRDLNAEDGKGKILIRSNIAESLGFKEPADAVGKKVIFTTQKGYQGDGAEIPPQGSDKSAWEKLQEKVTEIEAEIVGVATPPGPGDQGSIFTTMTWGRLINSWSNWEWDDSKRIAYEEKMKRSGIENWDVNDCPDCMILKTESEVDRQGYQMVYVKVDDPDNTGQVAEEVKKTGLGAMTAEDMLKMFTRILNVIATILATIGGISLGVATIGIINTMLMAMYERTREIGVMRACGAKKKTIRRLFMVEASSMGFLGGVMGIFIGFIITIVANRYLNNMLSSEGMAGENVAAIPVWLMLATVGITTFLGLVSGLYPAHRAAKLDPVEALRYE